MPVGKSRGPSSVRKKQKVLMKETVENVYNNDYTGGKWTINYFPNDCSETEQKISLLDRTMS